MCSKLIAQRMHGVEALRGKEGKICLAVQPRKPY